MFSVCPYMGVPRPGPDGGGVSHPALDRGGGSTPARSSTPSSLGHTPLARSRRGGVTQVPPPPGMWYPPSQLGQQKEYSLRGGRYASCGHAGELSCFYCKEKSRRVAPFAPIFCPKFCDLCTMENNIIRNMGLSFGLKISG